MRRVIIESPYAGDVDVNVAYARRAMRDALQRGESPIASYLLLTHPGVLDDAIPDERRRGIVAFARNGAGYGDSNDDRPHARSFGFVGRAAERVKSYSTSQNGPENPCFFARAGSSILLNSASRLCFTPKTASELM